MSCPDVRERLSEHALGLLPASRAVDIDRHVLWCAGCRRELAQLEEGTVLMGVAVPQVDPPPGLEDVVVDRVATAAGRRPPQSRRGVKLLAVATLAALLSATGALGWAIAEKRRADDVLVSEQSKVEQLEALQGVIEGLPKGADGGAGSSFQAELSPVGAELGFGRVVIFATPRDDDWVVVDVVPPAPESDRYTVRVLDGDGKALSAGELKKTQTGDWFFLEFSGKDLSAAQSVSVFDDGGRAVLFGMVRPYSGG
jgi:hypothetical protein